MTLFYISCCSLKWAKNTWLGETDNLSGDKTFFSKNNSETMPISPKEKSKLIFNPLLRPSRKMDLTLRKMLTRSKVDLQSMNFQNFPWKEKRPWKSQPTSTLLLTSPWSIHTRRNWKWPKHSNLISCLKLFWFSWFKFSSASAVSGLEMSKLHSTTISASNWHWFSPHYSYIWDAYQELSLVCTWWSMCSATLNISLTLP